MRKAAGKRWARWSVVVVMTFGLIEFTLRWLTGSLLIWGDWHVIDPVVGHVPRPGFAFRIPGLFRLSILEDGIRSNGPTSVHQGPITLAVGDSYTFGEGVSDHESWPAQLERRLARRVYNGGVTGFGLDQTVLRAEQLTKIYRPATIVVSFIPDDIRRSELSRFSGHSKPYFDIDPEGSLVYRPATHPRPWFWKRVLRLSLTLQIFAGEFLYSEGPDVATREPNQASIGQEVACALMGRLAGLHRNSGASIWIIAQPASPQEISAPAEEEAERVLDCARDQGLSTLNLFSVVAALSPDEQASLYDGHMSPKGNGVVAEAVAAVLRDPPPHAETF